MLIGFGEVGEKSFFYSVIGLQNWRDLTNSNITFLFVNFSNLFKRNLNIFDFFYYADPFFTFSM